MSLLSEAMESCHVMDKTTVPDGYGGFSSVWVDGAPFKAAITFDNSMEARRAQVQGVYSMYTVTTSKAISLNYHDVFVRERDGKVFRVTSDGDDRYTPASASLDMRQCGAEEFVLPTN